MAVPASRLLLITPGATAMGKVHGRPLPGSQRPVLHLTSLAGAPALSPAAAQRVQRSGCTVFFE